VTVNGHFSGPVSLAAGAVVKAWYFDVSAMSLPDGWTASAAPDGEGYYTLEKTPITVTFNANGGSLASTTAAAGADGRLASLPTPTLDSYDFDGWFTTASAAAQRATENDVYSADTALFAQWKKGDITWRAAEGILYIGGSGPMEDYSSSDKAPWINDAITIEKVVIGEGVTKISNYAFSWCTKLTRVTIPDSVITIGNYAFDNCWQLASVTIPVGVTSIGDSAFNSCRRLTSVTIPDSVTKIDDNAFSNCSSLTSVTISNRVTTIASSTFYNCSRLTSVTIPNNVTAIESGAFYNCSELRKVTIPNTVISVGDSAFFLCDMLLNVYYGGTTTQWDSIAISGGNDRLIHSFIHYGTEIGTGVYWDNSGGTLTIWGSGEIPDYGFSGSNVAPWGQNITSVVIHEGVTGIGGYAFTGCGNLASVTLPGSVASIGENAFSYCSSLQNLAIPDSVTSIGDFAFYHCSILNSVNIPENVTGIGTAAFGGCGSLSSVTLPKRITALSQRIFEDCTRLTNIEIPEGVIDIGASAFSFCSALRSVQIPVSVSTIGDNAFLGCSSLGTVTYAGTREEWDSVTIGGGNDYLENASINCTGSGRAARAGLHSSD